MSSIKLTTMIDDELYTSAQLNRIYYERTLHVLQELLSLGVTLPSEDGTPLSARDLNWLEPEKAIALLVDAHMKLGPEGTLQVYHDILLDSDRRWHQYNEIPIEEQGCHIGTCLTQVAGISPNVFQERVSTMHVGSLPFQIMPEHYLAKGDITVEKQTVIETFGLFGEPTYFYGTASSVIPSYVPVKRLEDYPAIMAGECHLVHDDFNIHVGAIHQIKPLPDGVDIFSSFFCPKCAPKAIADGHKLHFALEIRGMFETLLK
ncbi:MAG: hypothetical protein ACI3U1_02070 [Peptococcaceae bacterium]